MERFLSGVSVLFLLILFQSYTSATLSFCSMILSFEITKGSPNFILLSQICWDFFWGFLHFYTLSAEKHWVLFVVLMYSWECGLPVGRGQPPRGHTLKFKFFDIDSA